jgi:hypothetical protein
MFAPFLGLGDSWMTCLFLKSMTVLFSPNGSDAASSTPPKAVVHTASRWRCYDMEEPHRPCRWGSFALTLSLRGSERRCAYCAPGGAPTYRAEGHPTDTSRSRCPERHRRHLELKVEGRRSPNYQPIIATGDMKR